MASEVKKSKLVAVGCLIMILSIGINILLRKTGTGGAILDLFRLGFFAGLICCIIGWLRNRKLKKQANNSELQPKD